MTYDSDNVDKISNFVEELKKMKIKVLPPNINYSYEHFSVEQFENEKCIRYSLASLKNVGNEAVKKMINIRNKTKIFKDLDHFIEVVPQNIFGKRGLESLTMSGSFSDLKISNNKIFINQFLKY